MESVKEALDILLREHQEAYTTAGQLPMTDYVPEWNAPCYTSNELEEGAETVGWKPVRQAPSTDFANVEKALDFKIEPSLKTFYGQIWGGDVEVAFRDKSLTLIFAQCEQDMIRLQENLIGHVMMKQRLKQPVTWFIGVGEEEDLMLTLSQDTGVVGLEYVGQEQHEVLAGDLTSFLEQLQVNVVT